ncbi:MAG: 16S rRNA (guanine(966)-N(2))-methyltransferase RsmD [Proteobacteria bacterium]|nr:16S rRNA (guanine(966)-N(2))-methyltransferase RsmD [Pseudomonadota bacterium]
MGFIRIIAGSHRSRRIEVRDQKDLRPTTDRIREVLFNWLSPYMINADVLDLYSGSGALGFEAASRDAAEVLLLDNNSATIRQLKYNLQNLKFAQVDIIRQDALSFCQQSERQFDVIFLDPPFESDELSSISAIIHRLSSPSGLVYREYHKNQAIDSMDMKIWQLLKQKTAGQVCFELWQKI